MKQVFTTKQGVRVMDTTVPGISSGSVKIRVLYSCISSGTEMSAVNAAQKSLLERIKNNPASIKSALNKVKDVGLQKVLNKVGRKCISKSNFIE